MYVLAKLKISLFWLFYFQVEMSDSEDFFLMMKYE